MLDNGENLLWYVMTRSWIWLPASTAVAGKPLLPAGTQLTLVRADERCMPVR